MPALQDNTLAYVYDDYGNRTKKTVNNADINYYINDGLTVLNELDNAGNVTKTIVKGVGQIGEIDKDGNIFYTHQDALGSTILVTNQFGAVVQQYEYDPFGQIIGQAGLNDTSDTNYTYTNQEWDTESELYYYNARYYNPALGRFISRDTVLGQDGDILSRNLYIYVKNNPLKYVDPSGETTEAILRELKTSEKIWQYAVGAGEALSDIAYGSLDMLKNGIIMQQNPMLGLYNNISKGLALSENVYNNREQIISSVVNLKNNIIGGVPLSDPYWNDLSREEKGYWATQGAVAVGGGWVLGNLMKAGETAVVRQLPEGVRSYNINKLLKTQPGELTQLKAVRQLRDFINNSESGVLNELEIPVYIRDGEAYIVDGHHRIEAFKEAGYNRIPIKYIHENQIKNYGRSFSEMKSWANLINN